VLDGSKTGLTVRSDVLQRDTAKWQGRGPYWKRTIEEKAKLSNAQTEELCGRGGRLPFIMDVIAKEAPKAGERKLREIQKLFSLTGHGVSDAHLTRPWFNALKVARRYREVEHCDRRARDLEKILWHVEAMYQKRQSLRGDDVTNSRSLSWEFAAEPHSDSMLMDTRDINRVRASYAYLFDSLRNSWSEFPWEMAMRELCSIKGTLRVSDLRCIGTNNVISECTWFIKDGHNEVLRTLRDEANHSCTAPHP
jgi:RNA-dependent RNA polymerase